MRNLILIFFLFSIIKLSAQEIEQTSENSIELKVYNKCFEDFRPLPESEYYNSLKEIKFCNLVECVAGFEYCKKERNMQIAILKRAIEINNLLYNEHTPVILTYGMDSGFNANKKNLNINDDNNLIYISIADCLTTNSLEEFASAFNAETRKLINK